MAKIGLVSFQNSWNTINNATRWNLFKQIRTFALNNNVTHLLFSGSTLFDKKTQSDKSVEKIVNKVGLFFKKFSIIFEMNNERILKNKVPPYGLYAFEKGKKKLGPVCQLLATSKAPKSLYEELWRQIQSNERTVSLNQKKFLILICGELNILHNCKNDNNRVDGLRYQFGGGSIRSVKYDILFNPTHTPLKAMYGKYKNRLKYMSERADGRMAFLNFNVPREQKNRNAAFIAYKEGKEIVRKNEEREDWSNGWAMRIIEC